MFRIGSHQAFQAMAIQRIGCILWGCELVSIDLCRKTKELHWKLSSKITKMQRTRPKWWFGVWVWYRLMSVIYLLCPGQRCREDCNGTKWRNLFRWIAEQWNESCWRSYVLRTGVSRAIPRIASREKTWCPVAMFAIIQASKRWVDAAKPGRFLFPICRVTIDLQRKHYHHHDGSLLIRSHWYHSFS